MERERILSVAVLVFLVGAAGLVAVQAGYLPNPAADAHDRARVTVVDEGGEELAVVDARVADTPRERRIGLGETDSLENGSGMLFVLDAEDEHVFVMRNMDFPIDIVYADANGTITRIHHAREPPPGVDGESLRYPGYGKYVLEVPRGYANATGMDEGDRIEIEYAD
ncbi:DUF192 domain-containing protein [Halobacteriales archaeon QS_8_69_26]|nr:MAG: DUF192 domain-containing protein [Halobacteriales archaeon QS_8_69_26]